MKEAESKSDLLLSIVMLAVVVGFFGIGAIFVITNHHGRTQCTAEGGVWVKDVCSWSRPNE